MVDVGWHCQNYEGYAETIAKIIGYIYNDNSKKMEFKNLRRKTLSKMWLPSDEKHNEELEDDLVKQCVVDGKRSMKTDKRANSADICPRFY